MPIGTETMLLDVSEGFKNKNVGESHIQIKHTDWENGICKKKMAVFGAGAAGSYIGVFP
ncbi:MAG: hypothetical protein CM1200mP3_10870 [Chloroflexota bacterium]|nr:MAG: hypothetical protein CM1200mP3_10870 [Chloroflexota bacterium]